MPNLRHCLLLSVLAIAASACRAPVRDAPPAVHVAAAADLARAFPEVAAAFTRETGTPVVFTFGSSGLLARQVAEGGPWDAFASADSAFVAQVIERGACAAESRALYAQGRLALWWQDGRVVPPSGVADLADARFARIAIAHPEHAPYGRAAREALIRTGAWASVAPRLVFGENVQQALQFARSGNVEVAIVARSLVEADSTSWLAVDPALHAPLDQAIVACRGGGNYDGGLAWTRYVTSPPARDVLVRYGFAPPLASTGDGRGPIGHRP